jgi:hypothetical protein
MTRVDVLRHTDTPDDGFRCREAPLARLEDNPGYLPGRADVQDTINPSVGRRVHGDGIADNATHLVLLVHQAALHARTNQPELPKR